MTIGTSPGVYTNEVDLPTFVQATGQTAVLVVGGATRGPLNTPTRVTSVGQLVSLFGAPTTTDLGLQSAVEILQVGGNVVYLRVAHSTVATANDTLPGLTGGTAATPATGTILFGSTAQPNAHDYITISNGTTVLIFEFTADDSYTSPHIPVGIGSGAEATMSNLVLAINAQSPTPVTAVNLPSASVPTCDLTSTVYGTAGNVAITQSGGHASTTAVTGMTGGTAAVAGTSTSSVEFFAATPGSWANTLQVVITTPSVVVTAPSANFDLAVLYPPVAGAAAVQVEKFTNVSCVSSDPRFVDNALVNGVVGAFAPSQYITSTTLSAGSTPTANTYTLSGGLDGISGLTDSDYVGTVTATGPTGILAAANAESVSYRVLLVPGQSDIAVINAMISNANNRCDHIALIDPPIGLSYTNMISWINGGQPGGVTDPPTTALDCAYASTSWPWMQTYDQFNQRNVWLPPSAQTAAIMVQSDSAGGPWLAAAGANRGTIQGIKLEMSPDQSMRDALYAANVNPFVLLPGGITRFGNITLQRDATLLQSENARRCIIRAISICTKVVGILNFELNSANLQRKLVTLCNTALQPLVSAGALTQIFVVCDGSNNPPNQDPRLLNATLVLQPASAVERIVLSFTATSTSASFSQATVAA